jgi:diaminobutyrate-2-oxoglutarate transaminase
MFPGPTGANAVEAALKLARKVTNRSQVGAFTNAFHGMSLGALSVTGSNSKRAAAGINLPGVDRYPYCGYFGPEIDTIALIRRQLDDSSSGYSLPAAFIVESVQAEGGLNVAESEWLRQLSAICQDYGIILIIDDIQAGCGRTGGFFSFQRAGISPDIICLSKSLSGLGLPLSMVMIREELDVWAPGEHNGTFRGNNHAFVTAKGALDFWTPEFEAQLSHLIAEMESQLSAISQRFGLELCGLGMLRGLRMRDGALADAVCDRAFERGLLLETSGSRGEVVKIMPAITAAASSVSLGVNLISDILSSLL